MTQGIGSLNYMAPESLNREKYQHVSNSADIWGLGATIFQIRYGDLLLAKLNFSTQHELLRIYEEGWDSHIEALLPELEDETSCDNLIWKLLMVDAEDRLPCSEFKKNRFINPHVSMT